MRIALFHDLPSGGAKRSLHELVRRLAARHDIDLYSFSGADERFCDLRPWVRERHEFAHVPARLFSRPLGRLNALQRWRDLGCLSALAARVAAAIDGRGYDVLWAEPSIWTQAPLVLLHAATPSLYQFHEPLRAYYEPRLNRRGQTRWRDGLDRVDPLRALYRARLGRLDRAATRAARCVLVNSRYSHAQAHALYGVTAQVLRRGVDGERFRPAAATARRAEVLSVGALQPSKGFEFVVDSLARIPLALRPALRIIANSEVAGERAFIAQRATSQDVALHIEVGVDEARLVAAYGEAALLVYAPHHEPFGLAPLEAMACATPVVAVAEGGIPESVRDGVNGRLVERDPGAFAAAVQSLLGDPAACRRLGEQARDDVCTHWTWERSAAQLESEFESIAAGGEHPPAKEHTG